MKHKKKVYQTICFFVFDFGLLLLKGMKTSLHKKKFCLDACSKKLNKSLSERVFEQINVFLTYFLFQGVSDDLFLVFFCNGIKWIFPFSKKKKKFILKNKLNFFLSTAFFNQEVKIFKIENETKFFRFWDKNRQYLSVFFFLFFLFEKIKREKKIFSCRIFTFISEKDFEEPINLSQQLIFLAQKLKISFDTLVIGNDDFPTFHKISGKSGGFYCRPRKNLFRIIFTEELLDVLITLFLPLTFAKQFMICPFSTKNFNLFFQFSQKRKMGFFCHFCSSLYLFLPSNCHFCGINFIN